MNTLGIVIPVYNGASHILDCLGAVNEQTRQLAGMATELIIVDDGSSDNTLELVRNYRQQTGSRNIKVISLTRNFGKESAIQAGLNYAIEFDAVVVMDSDLQHPPELIPQMVEFWRQGSFVVEGVKSFRGEESVAKSLLVRSYFQLFNFLTRLNISNDTDFKLLDKSVVQAYCLLPESNRFFRGLMRWMNYPSQQIYFDVPDTGMRKSNWSIALLFRYAVSSITAFSAYPLQLVTLLGGITFLISAVIGSMALYDKLSGEAVDGFTTVILLILIIGSVLMFSLGLIGTYIGQIYSEVKRRPSFQINTEKSDSDLNKGDAVPEKEI